MAFIEWVDNAAEAPIEEAVVESTDSKKKE